MTIAKALLSGVCLTSLATFLAATPPNGEDSKKAKGAPTEKEIQVLIDQLASPNPKPILNKRGAPGIELPAGFDFEKQERVHLARSQLRELGPAAFPFLIVNGKDDRYSLTTCNGLDSLFRNDSVGKVCRTIIFDQLQPYGYWQAADGDPRGKPQRPGYPSQLLDSQEAAKAWWEKNKGKKLYQMQLDVLDWVIAEEAKRPGDFTEKEKQRLQKMRKELVEGQKPQPAGNYDANEIEYRY